MSQVISYLSSLKDWSHFNSVQKKAGYQADSIYLPIPTKSSQLELNCKLAGGYMVDVVQASYSSETSFLDCITIYRYSTCSLLQILHASSLGLSGHQITKVKGPNESNSIMSSYLKKLLSCGFLKVWGQIWMHFHAKCQVHSWKNDKVMST